MTKSDRNVDLVSLPNVLPCNTLKNLLRGPPLDIGGGGGTEILPGHLYINSGRWYLSHVPSTFATVNTHLFFLSVFQGTPGETKNSSRES